MTEFIHLSEAERQSAADGSLDGDTRREVEVHLAVCDPCAADVARLRSLMTRIRSMPPTSVESDDDLDALWPGIRTRIDASKVVHLAGATDGAPVSRTRRGFWHSMVWTAAGLAAGIAVLLVSLPRFRPVAAPAPSASTTDSTWMFTSVADSTSAYEAEATALLNDIEMRRALLPPQANASLDHDLRVIDDAIAEVKDALARDPNNPALRRLLASSYRQKVDLLKRAHGAS